MNRLILIFLSFTIFLFSQEKSKIYHNTLLKNAVLDISERYKKTVVFDDEIMKDIIISYCKVDLEEPITLSLNRLFSSTDVIFKLEKLDENQFVIKRTRKKAVTTIHTSISGYVYDEKKKPLENTMVYILNTTIGTYTDKNGFFKLDSIPKNNFYLLAQHVGLLPKIHLIDIQERAKQNFVLEKDTYYKSNEVIVYGKRNKKWQWLYKKFENSFLGYSTLSDHVEIKNPYIIKVYEDSDSIIHGWADQPIQIENRALGYDINFHLSSFLLRKHDGILRYVGYATFNEKKPKNSNEKEKWKKNRRMVFEGSIQHFFKAAYLNDLDNHGFYTQRVRKDNNKLFTAPEGVNFIKRLSNYANKKKIINYSGYLKVIHSTRPNEDYLHSDANNRNGYLFSESHTQSLIKFQNQILIDENGNFFNDDFTPYGYFSYFRVSGMMPIEATEAVYKELSDEKARFKRSK